MPDKSGQNEVEYLETIIRPLIANTVNIEKTVDDRGILLTVKLEQEDIGRIIGKQGETARSIRRLIRQFGMTNDKHIAMKIYEPNRENTKPKADGEKVSDDDLGL